MLLYLTLVGGGEYPNLSGPSIRVGANHKARFSKLESYWFMFPEIYVPFVLSIQSQPVVLIFHRFIDRDFQAFLVWTFRFCLFDRDFYAVPSVWTFFIALSIEISGLDLPSFSFCSVMTIAWSGWSVYWERRGQERRRGREITAILLTFTWPWISSKIGSRTNKNWRLLCFGRPTCKEIVSAGDDRGMNW